SERVVNSKAANSASRGGVVGVAANVGKPSGGTSGGGNSQEETLQTEYLVSKTVFDSEDRTGAVDRLTVAAMLDLSPGGGGGPPLSLAEAQDIIKQAVGFKGGRDEIKVTNVKLANAVTTEPDEEAAALLRFQAYVVMARNISLGLSALLAAVL